MDLELRTDHADACDGHCDDDGWQQPASWDVPPGQYVRDAVDLVRSRGHDTRDVPWCRVRLIAFKIMEETEGDG